jgi:hypothetical protein
VSYPHRSAEANIAGGKAFETRQSISRTPPPIVAPTPLLTGEADIASGEPHSPIVAPTPSLTAEANVASGEPHSPIVAPTPSLTAEANVASGEPVDLLAAESRRLMLVMVHTHRSSDSASSIFSQLTMYADPLAERVWSRLGGTHTSHSGTVGTRPRETP